MTDLLPCPFCRSTDVHLGEDYYVYGSCDDCGAQGPTFEPIVTGFCVYDKTEAKAKAVEAWNRRAAYAAVIDNTLHTVTVRRETPAPDDHSYSEDEETSHLT